MIERDIKVLCVDDQVDATSLMEKHLEGHFDCTFVSSPASALEALEKTGPYAVVVSDFIMPDMDGIELLQIIKQRWPDCVGIMVTAMDDQDVAIAALHEGKVHRFVRKPWEPEDLVRAVTEAANYFRLVQNERALREQLARTNAELDEKVQDLDEANELLEYWVEFSPAVLYSSSCEDGLIRPSYISKNFHRLTGFERTAAIIDPQFWSDLVHPDDRDAFEDTVARLLGGDGTHAVAEYRVRHRDGNYLTVLDSIRAVHDGDGNTIELVGAWLDVSARP
jgi:PAS domain S-box-containing protein